VNTKIRVLGVIASVLILFGLPAAINYALYNGGPIPLFEREDTGLLDPVGIVGVIVFWIIVGLISHYFDKRMFPGVFRLELRNYHTGEIIRRATAEEAKASRRAAERPNGMGKITVDGVDCYVL
jgi:hypothetical protein